MLGRVDRCLICGTTQTLHKHHIFYGTGNRQLSEQYGMTCMLCANHHNMSDVGVHFNKKNDLAVKRFAQRKFEAEYGHDLFMQVFGRNYL